MDCHTVINIPRSPFAGVKWSSKWGPKQLSKTGTKKSKALKEKLRRLFKSKKEPTEEVVNQKPPNATISSLDAAASVAAPETSAEPQSQPDPPASHEAGSEVRVDSTERTESNDSNVPSRVGNTDTPNTTASPNVTSSEVGNTAAAADLEQELRAVLVQLDQGKREREHLATRITSVEEMCARILQAQKDVLRPIERLEEYVSTAGEKAFIGAGEEETQQVSNDFIPAELQPLQEEHEVAHCSIEEDDTADATSAHPENATDNLPNMLDELEKVKNELAITKKEQEEAAHRHLEEERKHKDTKRRLDDADDQLDRSQEELNGAEAELNQAKAELNGAKVQLKAFAESQASRDSASRDAIKDIRAELQQEQEKRRSLEQWKQYIMTATYEDLQRAHSDIPQALKDKDRECDEAHTEEAQLRQDLLEMIEKHGYEADAYEVLEADWRELLDGLELTAPANQYTMVALESVRAGERQGNLLLEHCENMYVVYRTKIEQLESQHKGERDERIRLQELHTAVQEKLAIAEARLRDLRSELATSVDDLTG